MYVQLLLIRGFSNRFYFIQLHLIKLNVIRINMMAVVISFFIQGISGIL